MDRDCKRIKKGDGPRRASCPEDISEIAELLDISFSASLDLAARQMLRQVSWLASLGKRAWDLCCLLGAVNPEEWNHSVVWQENGRIVGNVTLTHRRPQKGAWLVSNVAVTPDYRRRGIARQLTRFAIAQIRSWGGRELYLQVDADNLSAANIYKEFGFREIDCRVTWIHPGGISAANPSAIENVDGCRTVRRQPEDWPEEYRFLAETAPGGLGWNDPLDIDRIRPSIWRTLDRSLAGESESHFLAWCPDGLAGVLLYTERFHNWEGLLIQRPGTAGRVETQLLRLLVRDGSSVKQGVVETTLEADPDCMTGLGFRKRRILVWMHCDLDGEPAPPG